MLCGVSIEMLDDVRGVQQTLRMNIEVRPATEFDDVAVLVGPKKPTSNVCFCLSYRIPSTENNRLRGAQRADRVRELCHRDPPPGVIAYLDDEPVGWAAVHPRRDTTFARNRLIPHVDDLDVWSLWCVRVRPGHRKQGISHALIKGAVAQAKRLGAPAIEGYPVDNRGEKVNLTMAYVGTRGLFEAAGFTKAADTRSTLDGFPRVLMRLDLRGAQTESGEGSDVGTPP
ncbi:Acetyltransferase (GNAT) family protein [Microbacterium foliorum]|uniref:Acetyltransferase (GNAT) family protein n=2 Tax=Microbacterium foliorum TaxID=104336 RepID=A0A0F0KQB9_9MICO|nr:Acetyltransferase (GNAT) family protein [Microbacterium foliorum]